MSIRSLLLIVFFVLVALFAAVNWSAFAAPTELSLVLGTVTAPVGVIMLCLMALLTIAFLTYAMFLQTSVLFESRRHAKEIQAQRELADKAEASRFTELRGYLATRIDALEQDLKKHIDEHGNSLAAHIGEVEDRFSRDPSRTGIEHPL